MNQASEPTLIHNQETHWPFWFTVPIYPYQHRRTLRREIVKDTLWTFDQLQGILYTIVPVRMTVVKLEAGGLLVYAPVAPTAECIGLLNELVAQHGDVKYILLPTSSGIEHKMFVGPFARRFPQAQVWVAPHQWSYPVNLPLSWLGFPRQRTQVLPDNPADAPFGSEFDYAILDIDLGQGAFGEVALLHKRSRTLLVTDSVIAIPADPPEIVQLDPYPLLFHARENALEPIADSPAARRRGWQRIALFATYLNPAALETVSLSQAWQEARKAPDRSRKAYFGFYPFRWRQNWQQSFVALRGHGRPVVAPVLQTFILTQGPRETLAWADRVAQWNFQYIIPAHFEAPIAAQPSEFRQAFAFLEQHPVLPENQPLPIADLAFLQQIEQNLTQRGLTTAAKAKL